MEYNLNAFTGGTPTRPVYVLPAHADGLISVTFSGAPGPTSVVVAGRGISGGATDNAIRLALPRTGGGAQGATANCIGDACNDLGIPGVTYVPGWGFTSDLKKVPSLQNSCATTNTCIGKYGSLPFGRINWRQLNLEPAP